VIIQLCINKLQFVVIIFFIKEQSMKNAWERDRRRGETGEREGARNREKEREVRGEGG
jgi:hypothetical protein